MNFCTIRDLRTNSKKIWGKDDVIVTNNGKPKAVLIKTDEEAKHGAVVTLMDKARYAGVKAISIDRM